MDLPAYLKRVDAGPPVQAVMQAINEGEHWLLAWNRQTPVIYRLLSRESGLSERRIAELEAGAVPTAADLAALGKAWGVEPGVIARTAAT